jgi:uncharacterized secreted protein with C-terminal beta-propeller domain
MLEKRGLALLIGAILVTGVGCDTSSTVPHISERSRTSPNLVSFDTCEVLEQNLKANLTEQMRVHLLSLNENGYGPIEDDMADAVPAPGTTGGRQEGSDYSGTNNQEAGVDEGDFVKTDGYYLYVLSGNQLVIMGVPEFGQLVENISVDIEGRPNQLLLIKEADGSSAQRSVVFSSISTYDLDDNHPLRHLIEKDMGDSEYYGYTVFTKITIIDHSNPQVPQVIDELYFEGSYQTSRKVDSTVHMFTYSWIEINDLQYWPDLPENYYLVDPGNPLREQLWNKGISDAITFNDQLIAGLTLQDLVPRSFLVVPDGIVAYDFTAQGCNNFVIAEDGMSRGFTSIVSFEASGDDITFEADHVVSNWSIIYASSDNVLLAEPAQDWWWYWDNDVYEEETNIHRFDSVATGSLLYSGSGRVRGTVLSQFSLSEYEGIIRVATTTDQWNRWWITDPPPPENHLYMLSGDSSLAVVGQLDGIAVGERIWSSRFIQDRGYLVTAQIIDPLWTIDLSDPENPTIMGELEVPGVSTYVHPLEDEHLLTIGFGGDQQGFDGSIKVSLFDVSDFANPRRKDVLTLFAAEGEDWSSWGTSEALYEHKAFQYWEPKKLLAVPLSTSRSLMDEFEYGYEYISKLVLVSVDTTSGLSIYGSVDHSDFYNSNPSNYWCYQDVRRSIFMGDYIYAISDRGVTASNLLSMDLAASLLLPGSSCEIYWDGIEAR